MSEIRSVHVLIAHPTHLGDRITAAQQDLDRDLPRSIKASCRVPMPYVEINRSGNSRPNVVVRITGLDTVCAGTDDARLDVINLIDATVKRHVNDESIEVQIHDADDIASRRRALDGASPYDGVAMRMHA